MDSLIAKYGKDAVRVDYPSDPLTDKQPINAKRMESLLAQQVFKEFGEESRKLDDRQKKVGAAKKLVDKRIKEHKKKSKATTNRSRRKSTRRRKSKQSESSMSEIDNLMVSHSSELSSNTIWCINLMNNMNGDCEDDESADMAEDPYVFARKKTTASDRATRYEQRSEHKEDD